MLALAARALTEEGARSVIVPPPFGFVASWKKFEKLAPVVAVPVFVIDAESVIGVPTAAVVGVTEPAIRSGRSGAMQ